MIDGLTDAFTCLAGTLAQEVHRSHPAIARAAEALIERHARTLETDVEAALVEYGVTGVNARSLALHFQVVLQGSFVLAKAQGDAEVARESVRYLKHYVTLLWKIRCRLLPDLFSAAVTYKQTLRPPWRLLVRQRRLK